MFRAFAATACFAAVALTMVGATPANATSDCRGSVSAEGRKQPNIRAARSSAMGAWQGKVASKLGSAYANWWYSGEREFFCDFDSKGTWYQCIAMARPCAPK